MAKAELLKTIYEENKETPIIDSRQYSHLFAFRT